MAVCATYKIFDNFGKAGVKWPATRRLAPIWLCGFKVTRIASDSQQEALQRAASLGAQRHTVCLPVSPSCYDPGHPAPAFHQTYEPGALVLNTDGTRAPLSLHVAGFSFPSRAPSLASQAI